MWISLDLREKWVPWTNGIHVYIIIRVYCSDIVKIKWKLKRLVSISWYFHSSMASWKAFSCEATKPVSEIHLYPCNHSSASLSNQVNILDLYKDWRVRSIAAMNSLAFCSSPFQKTIFILIPNASSTLTRSLGCLTCDCVANVICLSEILVFLRHNQTLLPR